MLEASRAARSRLNTALIVGNFIGGAVGSALAGLLWQVGGWAAIMSGAALIVAVALAVWFVNRKGALAGDRISPGG